MLFDNGKMTQQMRLLYEEAKQYFALQKRCLVLQGVEVLTTLLASMALWAIIILLGALFLLFFSFALAYGIGHLTGSVVLGFASIAALQLLLIAIIFMKRRAWIVEPIARFMAQLFNVFRQ